MFMNIPHILLLERIEAVYGMIIRTYRKINFFYRFIRSRYPLCRMIYVLLLYLSMQMLSIQAHAKGTICRVPSSACAWAGGCGDNV